MAFWGLTLEAGKRYAQKVETSFHLSMAALDVKGAAENAEVAVTVTVENNEFLICTLSRQKTPQQMLELNFQAGEHIAFMTKGRGVVHLTGYLQLEPDFPDYTDEEEEESEDEEISNEVKNALQKKRKPEVPMNKVEPKKPKMQVRDESEEESIDDEDVEEEEDDEIGDSFFDEEAGELSDDLSDEDEDDIDDEEVDDDDDDSSSDLEDTVPVTPQQQKQGQQKGKTPNKTPALVNGSPNKQQSNKKNKNQEDKTQTPKEKPGQTPKGQTPKGQTPKDKTGQTPKGQTPKEKSNQTPKSQNVSAESGQKKTMQGGVVVEDLVVGNGPAAKNGRSVKVYYVGRLRNNNKMFDSTVNGPGFKFNLGKAEVIKGWDVGVQGMKVGGKRRITCPPHMAYGAKGAPPSIPPNSWLTFEVELKGVS